MQRRPREGKKKPNTGPKFEGVLQKLSHLTHQIVETLQILSSSLARMRFSFANFGVLRG
jgi:hypothetical protein